MKSKTKKYNVRKLLSFYNIPFHEASSGHEIKINCIYHVSDTKKHMYINAQSGLFHCFSCNERGNFYKLFTTLKEKFVSTTLDLTSFETGYITILAQNNEDEKIEWRDEFYTLDRDSITGKVARDYLKKRGITDNQINYYSIRFAPFGDYANRIIIPVFNNKSELVSFVARDYTGTSKLKVLTPLPGHSKTNIKNQVFNLYNAIETKQLIIGEGVFDAISLGLSGVALFGKVPTEIQLAKIINCKPRRVTICLDKDAQYEAEKLARQLTLHVEDVRIARLENKDPNEEDPLKLKQILDEASKCDAYSFYYA